MESINELSKELIAKAMMCETAEDLFSNPRLKSWDCGF